MNDSQELIGALIELTHAAISAKEMLPLDTTSRTKLNKGIKRSKRILSHLAAVPKDEWRSE